MKRFLTVFINCFLLFSGLTTVGFFIWSALSSGQILKGMFLLVFSASLCCALDEIL